MLENPGPWALQGSGIHDCLPWLGWLACCALPWLGLAWACLACLALPWSSNNNRPPSAAGVGCAAAAVVAGPGQVKAGKGWEKTLPGGPGGDLRALGSWPWGPGPWGLCCYSNPAPGAQGAHGGPGQGKAGRQDRPRPDQAKARHNKQASQAKAGNHGFLSPGGPRALDFPTS